MLRLELAIVPARARPANLSVLNALPEGHLASRPLLRIVDPIFFVGRSGARYFPSVSDQIHCYTSIFESRVYSIPLYGKNELWRLAGDKLSLIDVLQPNWEGQSSPDL